MNFLQNVEAEGAKIVAEVKAGLIYLEHEGEVVIAWVEKEAPSAVPGIAKFLSGAEQAAASLATTAANGLNKEINSAGDGMQEWLMNVIESLGLSTTAANGLTTLDVSAVALIESIGHKLVSTSLASILSKLAPIVVAAA